MIKTTSRLVTNIKKKGDNRFRRYSWQFEDDPLLVLIQYVGDETIKTLNYHGNCKSENPRPINQLLPSIREEIVNSPKSAARIYEDMRLTAGTTPYQQSKFAPNNKSQVKNLQRTEKKRKREAIGDEVSPAPAPALAPAHVLAHLYIFILDSTALHCTALHCTALSKGDLYTTLLRMNGITLNCWCSSRARWWLVSSSFSPSSSYSSYSFLLLLLVPCYLSHSMTVSHSPASV